MTEREAISILNDIRQEARAYRLVPAEKEALNIAISALDKQKAKKPIKTRHGRKKCPSCSALVFNDDCRFEITKHCPNCGQKLDWSGE